MQPVKGHENPDLQIWKNCYPLISIIVLAVTIGSSYTFVSGQTVGDQIINVVAGGTCSLGVAVVLPQWLMKGSLPFYLSSNGNVHLAVRQFASCLITCGQI